MTLYAIIIDEPTIAMTFSVNNSPFAGKGHCYLSPLRERLFKEMETNVSIQKLEETESP